MYKVRGIKYGNQLYPSPAVFYFRGWGQWTFLELYFFLLQSDDHTVLADVGMTKAYVDEVNPEVIRRLDGDERGAFNIYVDPPDALAQIGVSTEDIDHIIITHCHLDHIAAVPSFTHSTFITSRYGLEWVVNPPYESLKDPIAFPGEIVDFLWAEAQKPDGRVILTDDEAEPLPGIRTIRTGGHSMDSQILFVETEKGTVGLGVDNVITYEHWDKRIAPGQPVSLMDALKAMELLEQQADIIIPGHAPDLYERYPDGVIVG